MSCPHVFDKLDNGRREGWALVRYQTGGLSLPLRACLSWCRVPSSPYWFFYFTAAFVPRSRPCGVLIIDL